MPETLTTPRQYTRTDFTALRAFVQRVAPATIGRLYFSNDDGTPWTAAHVERHLREMQADLVRLAIEHGSPVLADHLKAAARKHGSAKLTAVSLSMVEQAAQLAVATPAAGHGVGMWFRPLVADRLKARQIRTLGEFVAYCNARGGSWWRSVPRIGAGRARHLVAWLRRHAASLGVSVEADVDTRDPFVADDADLIEIGTREGFAPLERMTLAHPLSGADGANRAALFPYIQAPDDLAAVRAYLYQYRDQPKTLRVYTRELERFLLWAVTVRRIPLSAVFVDDCEAYKDFLKAPDAAFVGPRAPRHSRRWRPFASPCLSPASQRYAVGVVRAAFAWFVEMRYLAGNPWKGVGDPPVVAPKHGMQIGRALPDTVWDAMRAHAQQQAAGIGSTATQWRVVLPLMLLMGDSGLRREEAAHARREAFCLSPHAASDAPVWQLTVVGKRNKTRTVPVSPDTVAALRAHWQDRGEDLERADHGPLLAPLVIPRTPQAMRKHDGRERQPYSVDAFNDLIEWVRNRFVAELAELDETARRALVALSPHAFRHTFGTQAVAHDVPLDVVQRILGHTSLQTTSIYVQAEAVRMMREASGYYRRHEMENLGGNKHQVDNTLLASHKVS